MRVCEGLLQRKEDGVWRRLPFVGKVRYWREMGKLPHVHDEMMLPLPRLLLLNRHKDAEQRVVLLLTLNIILFVWENPHGRAPENALQMFEKITRRLISRTLPVDRRRPIGCPRRHDDGQLAIVFLPFFSFHHRSVCSPMTKQQDSERWSHCT